MIVLGLLMVLGIILSVLAEKNRELSKENALLREIMEKSAQHANTSEAEVHSQADHPDHHGTELSEKERIIALVAEGRSTEDVARVLNVPLDKVEMIIKFERIKQAHDSS